MGITIYCNDKEFKCCSRNHHRRRRHYHGQNKYFKPSSCVCRILILIKFVAAFTLGLFYTIYNIWAIHTKYQWENLNTKIYVGFIGVAVSFELLTMIGFIIILYQIYKSNNDNNEEEDEDQEDSEGNSSSSVIIMFNIGIVLLIIACIYIMICCQTQDLNFKKENVHNNVIVSNLKLYFNENENIPFWFHELQNEQKCCGIFSPNDWKEFLYPQDKPGLTLVPESCCVVNVVGCNHKILIQVEISSNNGSGDGGQWIHSQGCVIYIKQHVQSLLNSITYCLLSFILGSIILGVALYYQLQITADNNNNNSRLHHNHNNKSLSSRTTLSSSFEQNEEDEYENNEDNNEDDYNDSPSSAAAALQQNKKFELQSNVVNENGRIIDKDSSAPINLSRNEIIDSEEAKTNKKNKYPTSILLRDSFIYLSSCKKKTINTSSNDGHDHNLCKRCTCAGTGTDTKETESAASRPEYGTHRYYGNSKKGTMAFSENADNDDEESSPHDIFVNRNSSKNAKTKFYK